MSLFLIITTNYIDNIYNNNTGIKLINVTEKKNCNCWNVDNYGYGYYQLGETDSYRNLVPVGPNGNILIQFYEYRVCIGLSTYYYIAAYIPGNAYASRADLRRRTGTPCACDPPAARTAHGIPEKFNLVEPRPKHRGYKNIILFIVYIFRRFSIKSPPGRTDIIILSVIGYL